MHFQVQLCTHADCSKGIVSVLASTKFEPSDRDDFHLKSANFTEPVFEPAINRDQLEKGCPSIFHFGSTYSGHPEFSAKALITFANRAEFDATT